MSEAFRVGQAVVCTHDVCDRFLIDDVGVIESVRPAAVDHAPTCLVRTITGEFELINADEMRPVDPEALTEGQLLDLVDLWHSANLTSCRLPEFIGWSPGRYAAWVEGRHNVVGGIVRVDPTLPMPHESTGQAQAPPDSNR